MKKSGFEVVKVGKIIARSAHCRYRGWIKSYSVRMNSGREVTANTWQHIGTTIDRQLEIFTNKSGEFLLCKKIRMNSAVYWVPDFKNCRKGA